MPRQYVLYRNNREVGRYSSLPVAKEKAQEWSHLKLRWKTRRATYNGESFDEWYDNDAHHISAAITSRETRPS